MNKHYQIASQKTFLDSMMNHSFDFPLNIVEIKAIDFKAFYKKISNASRKNDWKNTTKTSCFYRFENRFFKNQKVVDLLREKKVKEDKINKITNILTEYHLQESMTAKFDKLEERLQTIFNFILLSENNPKILVNAGWFHIQLLFPLFYFLNDFLKSGGQCILVRNRHFDNIKECYDEYDKYWITEAEKKLKIWYLD